MITPKIQVEISNIEYNIRSIAELLYSNADVNHSLPFRERIYHSFPLIAGSVKEGMSNAEIYDIINGILIKEYKENAFDMMKRRIELSEQFNKLQTVIIPKMLELFEVDWTDKHQAVTCYLGLYAVFPRDVLTKEYWLHYRAPEDVVMRASIHEINHFILFEKWKAMHGYTSDKQPSHPEILWFLEEMAVDPTLNSPEMQEAAPYPQKSYASFYENKINGIPIEDYIIDQFKNRSNMADFLDNAYRFISENYNEILVKCG